MKKMKMTVQRSVLYLVLVLLALYHVIYNKAEITTEFVFLILIMGVLIFMPLVKGLRKKG